MIFTTFSTTFEYDFKLVRLRLKINHEIVSKWSTLSLNILPKGELFFRRGTVIFFFNEPTEPSLII